MSLESPVAGRTEPPARPPVVAIVGRPNVGKSTLLNRIVGRREAIVEERPGVARDRKAVDAEWRGRQFTVVDTGGWMPGGDALDAKVSRQAEQAVAEADVVLFVVDARVGVTDDDARVAKLLRRRSGVLVVANKVDDQSHEPAVHELWSLALGTPYPVSALHGGGSGDLLDAVVEHLDSLAPPPAPAGAGGTADPPGPDGHTPEGSIDAPTAVTPRHPPAVPNRADDEREQFSVAIVGRPNVGKSTLFNRLIGEDRSVVHDMPGTTRDAIDTVLETPEGPIRFVDTAGMRRRARISEGTEYYSLVRALKAIDEADVALLVIDATDGVTHQDQRLAERVDAAGCPVVVVLNKWELLDTEDRLAVAGEVERRLHFLADPPVLRISALTGKGVNKLWPLLEGAVEHYRRRIPTRRVNEVIRSAQQAQPAPHGARVLYATQGATDPPTFTLFANRELPRPYLRYLERRIRESFDLGGTPIKLRVRKRTD